jgi:DNA helicase-2/ATP-dependent DNA helicase PcrA
MTTPDTAPQDGAHRDPAGQFAASRRAEQLVATLKAAGLSRGPTSAAQVQLDPEQHAAVLAPRGPIAVIAGPGAGKTRTLVERIVRLVEHERVDPRRILAVTFTRRAAEQLRERLSARLGPAGAAVEALTFHAWAARRLRERGGAEGRNASFSVWDDHDQTKALQRAVEETAAGLVTPGDVAEYISDAKTHLLTPAASTEPPEGTRAAAILDAWRRYEETLVAANAFDYDDLLNVTLRALEQDEAFRAQVQARYDELLVDEYQDMCLAQARLVTLVAEPHRHVFVVGDPDQSIYSWRGAHPGIFEDFAAQFPEMTEVRLSRNYRSTSEITQVADAIARGGQGEPGTKTTSARGPGGTVQALTTADDQHEGQVAAATVAAWLAEGVDPGEIVVMARTHWSLANVEAALREQRVAYRVLGGVRFFAREEIADTMAWIRLSCNPQDSAALARVLRAPRRGIGQTTQATVLRFAETAFAAHRGDPEHRSPAHPLVLLTQTLRSVGNGLGPTKARALEQTAAWLETISAADSPAEAVEAVLRTPVGYATWLAETKTDAAERLENLETLHAMAATCSSVEDLLERCALDGAAETPDEGAAVTVATVHAMKGLEAQRVVIVGLDEGTMPHRRACIAEEEARDAGLDGLADEQIAEERRIAYVAASRAKDHLVLLRAIARRTRRGLDFCTPSRFLLEAGVPLDTSLVE